MLDIIDRVLGLLVAQYSTKSRQRNWSVDFLKNMMNTEMICGLSVQLRPIEDRSTEWERLWLETGLRNSFYHIDTSKSVPYQFELKFESRNVNGLHEL